MYRHAFDKIWQETADQRGWDAPTADELDMSWACIGILGRFSCPKKFERDMLDEDSEFAECLAFEAEKNLN